VLYKPAEFTAAALGRSNVVIHLHGSLKDPDAMVLTTPDYLTHYANDRKRLPTDPENPVLTFLEDLFSFRTVLFVGYGLEELEILEYVILKSHIARSGAADVRHYIIQGYFSHERELMLVMKSYYREFGLELLPFLKDLRGWYQLLEVLDEFAVTLRASSLSVSKDLLEMERLLNG